MFKEILNFNPNTYDFVATVAKIGLLIFFVVFVSMSIFAMTRRKKDVARWGALALDEGDVLEPTSKK
ncbi:MAG: hypothetical protein QM770_14905 [Tepidisphaeraceae bacterium]